MPFLSFAMAAASPHDRPTEYPREPVKPAGPKPGDEPAVPKPR